ncbi:MAG: T9SS type A sorting domain-containing protein [Ignavibacteriales bacterium]|nr:MAG: T9SS type A sorting domain-containing protein [Ignavibacteriales bacterium]
MKKSYLGVLLAAVLFGSVTFAQVTVFSDNFDSYVAGQRVACQNPTEWTTWSNSPCSTTEDALVSTNFAYSGANSFVITQNIDFVRLHNGANGYTSGKYKQSMRVYIPAGKAGYWNTLSDFTFTTGGYWAFECYFNVGGAGVFSTATDFNFTWTPATWMLVEVVTDLDNNTGEFWLNGTLQTSWVWTAGATTGTGPMKLDASDFFGATANDEMYVDNYTVTNEIVPVELTSFTAQAGSGEVTLNWSTASELNNLGFEIQRRTVTGEQTGEWTMVGFKEGHGTTSEAQNYTYSDDVRDINADAVVYRLKQIDFNGNYEYSPEVLVDNLVPLVYGLEQNYPNPFNPSTVIKYNLPSENYVSLKVYNTLGQEVATLVNEIMGAGSHEVSFNAKDLSSGIYYYTLRVSESNGNEKVFTNKMMLMK